MSKKTESSQQTPTDGAKKAAAPVDAKATKKEADAQAASARGETDEEPSADAAAETVSAEAVALRMKVSSLEERLANTRGQYKAALEDFEAAKARLRRDVLRDVDAGRKTILTDLLEVLDNLERALETSDESAASAGLRSGVMMVRDQFLMKLEAQGVRRVAAQGQPFDPSCFEAISVVPVEDAAQDGVVLSVVRDAYRLGEDILRPGMVAVGKHTGAHGG